MPGGTCWCFKSELEVTCVEKCMENLLQRVLVKLHILSSLRPCSVRTCASDQSYMFEGCVSYLTSVMHNLWSGERWMSKIKLRAYFAIWASKKLLICLQIPSP